MTKLLVSLGIGYGLLLLNEWAYRRRIWRDYHRVMATAVSHG